MEVKSGDRIPADIRVISAQGCKVKTKEFHGAKRELNKPNKCHKTSLLAFLSRWTTLPSLVNPSPSLVLLTSLVKTPWRQETLHFFLPIVLTVQNLNFLTTGVD